jgi:hypothetical protein
MSPVSMVVQLRARVDPITIGRRKISAVLPGCSPGKTFCASARKGIGSGEYRLIHDGQAGFPELQLAANKD